MDEMGNLYVGHLGKKMQVFQTFIDDLQCDT